MKNTLFVTLILLLSAALPLFSLDEGITPVGKVNPAAQDTVDFNAAMALWNGHQWKSAEQKFKNLLDKYPDSPWAPEAEFHVGCLCDYEKNYDKARTIFEKLARKHKGASFENKSKLRLAGVYIGQEKFDQSAAVFKEVLENNPTSAQRKYAFSWYRQLIRAKKAAEAEQVCGPRALGLCLEMLDKKEGAQKLLAIRTSEKPYSFQDMLDLAKSCGVDAYGVNLSARQLPSVPKPVILYLPVRKHFVVLQRVENNLYILKDPLLPEPIRQPLPVLQKEWSGKAIIFSRAGISDGSLLSAAELRDLKGGCCGRLRPVSGVGGPACEWCDTSSFFIDWPPTGGCSSCSTCSKMTSEPKLSINGASLNTVVQTTPIGYQPALGPGVSFTFTYSGDNPEAGAGGLSWGSTLDFRIFEQPDGSILLVDTGGNQTTCSALGGGSYTVPRVKGALLQQDTTSNTFLLTTKAGTKYFIGTNQRPYRIEDAHGHALTYGYSATNRPVSVTDAMGRTTTITYNAADKVAQIQLPDGRTTTFGYDTLDRLTTITNPLGASQSFSYDSTDNIISYSKPSGGAVNLSYNAPYWTQYEVVVTGPNGKTTHFLWDGMTGNMVTPPSASTQSLYVVDSRNLVTDVTHIGSAGGTRHYDRDGEGQLLGLSDELGHSTSYSYDSLGNVVQVTNALSEVTTSSYDTMSNLLSTTSGGKTTTFTYDTQGNMLTRQETGGGLTALYQYTYDSQGKMLTSTDPQGNQTQYQYDSFGRLIKIIDPLLKETTFGYDASDRKIWQKDHLLRQTSFSYDLLDRVTQILYVPTGKTVEYTYTCCNLASAKDEADRVTNYTYNTMGLLVQVAQPGGHATSYAYDDDNRLSSITDGNGVTTLFAYDYANRLWRKTYADATYEQYEYDVAGNMTKKTKTDGKAVGYTYDALNRLIEAHPL